MRHRRGMRTVYGLSLALVVGVALSLSGAGLTVLASGSALPNPKTRWIVIGRAADCADGYQLAMRRAHRYLTARPDLIVFSLDGGARLPNSPFKRAAMVRQRLLMKNLWLAGVRGTPVLIQIPANGLIATVEPLLRDVRR